MAKKLNPKELGFGSLAADNGQRFMNADGSANVHRIGGPLFSASDVFHKLTTMSWRRFLFLVFCIYMIFNLFFGLLYYAIGVQYLNIVPSGNSFIDFMECFFFSTQCFTTIGFGRVNPQGFATNIMASVEGLVGLLSFALATGLLYGRFSRPMAQLAHSENLLIAPYRETKKAAMFRIASMRRHSLLIENTVSLSFGINKFENGETRRRFFTLDLEIEKINFMPLSWTVVHPITPESPLWDLQYEDLKKGRAEFLVLFKAIEETTSQTVLERLSYFVDDIIWAARFKSIIGTSNQGRPILDLTRINDWEPANLPEGKVEEEPKSAEG